MGNPIRCRLIREERRAGRRLVTEATLAHLPEPIWAIIFQFAFSKRDVTDKWRPLSQVKTLAPIKTICMNHLDGFAKEPGVEVAGLIGAPAAMCGWYRRRETTKDPPMGFEWIDRLAQR